MALKKCKECNNSVSTTAKTCPRCGAVLKRQTGCFTKLVLLGFALFVVLFLFSVLGSQLVLISSQGRKSSTSATSVSTVGSGEKLSSEWSYIRAEDKMSGRDARQATIWSTNEVNFAFPYSGPQRGTLSLRLHPRFGDDIIFSIERGQLLGDPLDKKKVTVRFDDATPIEFDVIDSNDQNTTAVFIANYWDFYSKLKVSKRVRISIPVYQEGNPVFEFDVGEFDEKKLTTTGG